MEDTAILELYWARDEQAIAETQKSYGKYCYSIAYHIPHPGIIQTFLGIFSIRQ